LQVNPSVEKLFGIALCYGLDRPWQNGHCGVGGEIANRPMPGVGSTKNTFEKKTMLNGYEHAWQHAAAQDAVRGACCGPYVVRTRVFRAEYLVTPPCFTTRLSGVARQQHTVRPTTYVRHLVKVFARQLVDKKAENKIYMR